MKNLYQPEKSVEISKKKKSAKAQNTNDNGIEVMPFKETPTPSVQKSFIDNYSFLAIAEMDRTGIPASVILAQAILESSSGTSLLFKKHNAAFGIKCFSKTCKQSHCIPIVFVHNGDHHKDFYRVYPSIQASFTDHSRFIITNSYKQLLKFGKDYKKWVHGLTKIGLCC